jgi:hypothetical protein
MITASEAADAAIATLGNDGYAEGAIGQQGE